MDFFFLFARFQGRINRPRFWLGVLILMCGAFVLPLIQKLLPLTGTSLDPVLISLPLLYALVAMMVKRLHDCNCPAHVLALVVVPVAGAIAAQEARLGNPSILLTAFALTACLFIGLGWIRGSAGANRFGPRPVPQPLPGETLQSMELSWKTRRNLRI